MHPITNRDPNSTATRSHVGRIWRSLYVLAIVAVSVLIIVRMRRSAARRECQENLVKLDGAKGQWELLDSNRPNIRVPSAQEFVDQGILGKVPVCPAGGSYVFKRVGDGPICTSGLPGHSLGEMDPVVTVSE